MDILPTAAEKQHLVSSFLEIAVGQTTETATQFLQATSWKLDEALQLFFVGGDGGGVALNPLPPVVDEGPRADAVANESVVQDFGEDEVRAPLPVKRDTLYGDVSFTRVQPSAVVAFRNFEEESRQSAFWQADQNAASTENGSRDNLASLYRPPLSLMYNGPFDKAKIDAAVQGKWLLINLQSTEEFSSHMLNRDTWANETVAQTIRTNFIFWQVYHDSSEGKKVCTYYNLVSIPAILVIDPITGQKMRAWSGMVQPERLLEDLLPYLDKGPKEHHNVLPQKRPRDIAQNSKPSMQGKAAVEDDEELLRAVAASLEESKGLLRTHAIDDKAEPEKDVESSSNGKPPIEYPPLPEEPQGSRDLLCRVGVRLPNGQRLQRKFLRADSTKLLWSFCCSKLEDGEKRSFHFTQAIPGAPKKLEYESSLTFEEAGLSNSMVSLAWD
ncbi:plant UBX domain-containing protein 7 [Typha angustifolia]|uniref:plant UBX domain-containing protein 7 n=1 Tax=Typha angustifolia TaxID=59011 RepID=UPI003C2BA425